MDTVTLDIFATLNARDTDWQLVVGEAEFNDHTWDRLVRGERVVLLYDPRNECLWELSTAYHLSADTFNGCFHVEAQRDCDALDLCTESLDAALCELAMADWYAGIYTDH